jgi:hypothetical protein
MFFYKNRLKKYVHTHLKKDYDWNVENKKFKKYNLFTNRLNSYEQVVFKNYIEGASTHANGFLRGKKMNSEMKKRAKEYCYLFSKILKKQKKIKSKKAGILYRGLKLPLFEFNKQFKNSNTYTNSGFMSTTLEKGKGQNFVEEDANLHLNEELIFLEIEYYYSARPIHGFMEQYCDGREHVFLPNSQFKIIDISTTGPYEIRGSKRLVHEVKLKEK